jgi:drug/metabolite transporter (DMT)-like permease
MIGYFFFGDRMTFNKILAAVVIVIGVVLTRY